MATIERPRISPEIRERAERIVQHADEQGHGHHDSPLETVARYRVGQITHTEMLRSLKSRSYTRGRLHGIDGWERGEQDELRRAAVGGLLNRSDYLEILKALHR